MKHSGYIKGFDTLRAISILMVLITHLGLYQYFEGNAFLIDRVWHLFSGLTGVQIFFTISGFLITRILLQEKINFGKINFWHFYVRRFIRLLPALIVFYFIYLLFYSLKWIPLDPKGLMFSITYLYNFIPNAYYSGILGHMWSLGVEEQFYILWPLVISLFYSVRAYFVTVIVFLLLSLIAIYWLPDQIFAYHGNHYSFGKAFQLERWFIPAVLPIVLGSCTAALMVYKEAVVRRWSPSIGMLLATLFFCSPLYLPESFLPFKYAFQSVGISLILLMICLYPESSGVRFIHRQPFIYIGKISYGIYVFQGIFQMTGPGSQLKVQQFPLNIILTLLVAVLSYELIEKKCLRLKHKFTARTS